MAWDIEYTDEFGDWWETLTEAEGAVIMARPFSELRAKMSPERRERNHQRALELLAQLPLTELRHARQLSQEQLAVVLHAK